MPITRRDDLLTKEIPLTDRSRVLREILYEEVGAYITSLKHEGGDWQAAAVADLGVIFVELILTANRTILEGKLKEPLDAGKLLEIAQFTDNKLSQVIKIMTLLALAKH